jgi:hypothetical protein
MREALIVAAAMVGLSACSQPTASPQRPAVADDGRTIVEMPPKMVSQFQFSMRDYLQTISDIQGNMAKGQFEQAGDLAEQKLGMSAHRRAESVRPQPDLVKYLPPAMRGAGESMHSAASGFAVAAKKAAKTGQTAEAWETMSTLVANCNACHNAYRLRPKS